LAPFAGLRVGSLLVRGAGVRRVVLVELARGGREMRLANDVVAVDNQRVLWPEIAIAALSEAKEDLQAITP